VCLDRLRTAFVEVAQREGDDRVFTGARQRYRIIVKCRRGRRQGLPMRAIGPSRGGPASTAQDENGVAGTFGGPKSTLWADAVRRV
jgi:hypothetical protein